MGGEHASLLAWLVPVRGFALGATLWERLNGFRQPFMLAAGANADETLLGRHERTMHQ